MKAFFLICVVSLLMSAALPDLESLRWHKRVLLVFAVDDRDAELKQQAQIAHAQAAGFEERHLELVRVIGDEGKKLRTQFHVTGTGFAVLLLGKDGGVKLRSLEPITADELFSVIDAMPMRKEEMRRTK